MTREDALKKADEVLLALLESGDERIFDLGITPDGIDYLKVASAAWRAREKLADKIQAGEW